MKFLKFFLASFLAIVAFFFASFLFFGLIFLALDSEGGDVTVSENSVLQVDLNKPLADRSFSDPFTDLGLERGKSEKIGVIDLKKALTHAATDDKIKGIVLTASSLMGGAALGEEVRNALSKFKSSGKFILSYADYLTEGGFYLSSVANELYISPAGILEWNGLSSKIPFLKGTFEKLEIEPQIFRVGKYKSAIEPLVLTKMSDENRLQVKSFLNAIYNQMVASMAPDLGMKKKTLKNISDKMLAQNLKQAKKLGLISDILYKDQFLRKVADRINVKKTSDIEFIKFQEYNRSFNPLDKTSKNKIAVVLASGDIIEGKGGSEQIGSDDFTKIIRKAREDDNIKAVVLRINSGGGSALASDLIWREVKKTSEVKPVIASFGNYAASGGYYIGMAADTIIAQPNTITGSIGVFGVIFNMNGFMKNKLGITTDVVNTGEFSGMMTLSRALKESEKNIIQNNVNDIYEMFTTKAAQGRNMNVETLKSIASGRVWTGSQARSNGLVDLLGNLDDAVTIAARKAGVADDYELSYFPKQRTMLKELLEKIEGETQAHLMKNALGPIYPYASMIEQVKSMKGIQARMLYAIEVN